MPFCAGKGKEKKIDNQIVSGILAPMSFPWRLLEKQKVNLRQGCLHEQIHRKTFFLNIAICIITKTAVTCDFLGKSLPVK